MPACRRRVVPPLFTALLVVGLVAGCTVAPAPRPYYGEPVVVVPPPARVEYVPVAPPPPRYEYVGPAPTVGYVWIGGYWNWAGGRHEWVPGRWESPRHGHYWVPHRWQQRDSRWSLHGGYWQRH